MYDERNNKRGIQWGNLLRGAIKFLVIIIALFLIIFVVTKCTRGVKNIKSHAGTNTQVKTTLSNQMASLQEATIKYANDGNLPTAAYASKTVRLKELKEQGMIGTLKDSKGNECSTSGTYARITKLENNYMTRLNVVCNKKTESKTVYIGCFSDCPNGKVCLGSKNKLEGLCAAPQTTKKTESTVQSTSSNSTPVNTDHGTVYTATGVRDNNNYSNNTSNNTSTNTNTSTYTPPKTRTMYEFKKYQTTYSCSSGVLVGNKCELYSPVHYDFNEQYGHIYTCEGNKTYKLVNGVKTCVTYIEPVANKTVVDTTWSYSTYLAGYERTGNTKQVTE